MNSRQKGKRGEREAASFLTEGGFPAQRGCQFAGSPDSPDIICPALLKIHFEVKRTQRTDLYSWLAQAKTDAGKKLPVVLHRKNDSQWVAILDARDFLALVRETDLPRAGHEQTQREAEHTWPSARKEGTEP